MTAALNQRPSMFLCPAEVEELTGYKIKRFQGQWLRENGYPFELDKGGWPKVLRAVVVARLGGNVQTDRPPRLRLE